MWTLLVILSLAFQNAPSEPNYFEGWIKYKHDIVLKNRNLDSLALKEFVGEGSTLFFKEGNYLHKFEGGFFIQACYRKDDNKQFFKKDMSDTSYWVDCGKAGDAILRLSLIPNKEKIIGVDCDELSIYYEDKIIKDYYNSELFGINPDWFKNYKLDGQNQIDEKEKAVCLMRKTEYADFIVIERAVSFSKEKVDEKIFKQSPNEILVQQE